jgi:hypothetical protein
LTPASRENDAVPEFVGRSEPLGRLVAAHRAVVEAPAGAPAPTTGLVLVTGVAGIGKTALLRRFAEEAAAAGATVGWGTCWDDRQAPAWWPWTEALRALMEARPGLDLPGELAPLLSPARSGEPTEATTDAAGRVRLLDAAGGFLAAASAQRPVVVVLDDLQWSDPSTLDLVRFLARRPATGQLLLVGAYRPAESPPAVAATLAELAMSAELVPLQSLGPVEVTALVEAIAGPAAASQWGPTVHARSGGHPFLVRELCRGLVAGEEPGSVPPAVRDLVRRRLAMLPGDVVSLLATAAVAGSAQSVGLLAEATGRPEPEIVEALAVAADAGVLTRDGDIRFAHDLYREAVLADLPAGTRVEAHRRLTEVLAERRRRGERVYAGDLARHAVAALPTVPAADAITWAREAAEAEEGRYAFAEAAGHLGAVRSALAAPPVHLVVAEAELHLKAGDGRRAQELLDQAWVRATELGDAGLMGAVALGLDRCGARFAMPRERLVGALEAAREALGAEDRPVTAQVTAALARQLQHSVPADRPRARPLADEAVAMARRLADAPTLASCLLAQHDSLWTPGTAVRRVEIAREITALTRAGGDREALAQGLLLTANAQLESGSPAFRATVREFAAVTRDLRQPRHDYVLLTREAALALLDGDIDRGDRLSAEAAELGESVGESDAGNVRMSQRLEVVRARGRPEELRETAALAVEWWVGATAHAHAIAAGFLARAGDLDGARRELDTVLSLDDWRADRSYLWSVFVGELATAAIAVGDRDLCRRLLDDMRPLRDTCAVNGALVCFMGAHAHHLGLLHAALGDRRNAESLLRAALATHERLGAAAWAAETAAALAGLARVGVTMRHAGDLWEVGYAGRTATVRDSKGLRDLAVLLDRPGVDVPALELAGTDPQGGGRPEAVLDRSALAAYRRRLHELEGELADAGDAADLGRVERLSAEREAVLAELRRSTRPDGSSRGFGAHDAERARKAVSARIRDAIGRIGQVHPELGEHLDRSVVTGTACRYEPAKRRR